MKRETKADLRAALVRSQSHSLMAAIFIHFVLMLAIAVVLTSMGFPTLLVMAVSLLAPGIVTERIIS